MTKPARPESGAQTMVCSGLGLFASAMLLVAAVPAVAGAGEFSVLSYNVRGIPPPAIEDRTAEIAQIAPLLEDFHTAGGGYSGIPSFVGLQELFYQNYYDVLTDGETVTYPYITPKDNGGPAFIGDGLNDLSDFKIDEFVRTQWEDCFGTMGAAGSDCDTNKGYARARVYFEDDVFVDIYTLHADAGQDDDSRAARRANIKQLINGINEASPEGTPVIVFGDTNSQYTRVGNDNIQDLLTEVGLKDVWVELRRGGVVPGSGPDIDADCLTDPSTANCELVDKVMYRNGEKLQLEPDTYEALKTLFSDESDMDLSDHYPVAVHFNYYKLGVETTTTTTSSTTTSSSSTSTTSTMIERPCGDPQALVAKLARAGIGAQIGASAIGASDALFVLKAAVGSVECPLCTCDVNNSLSISAPDALLVLKKAVGQDVTLVCPPCL